MNILKLTLVLGLAAAAGPSLAGDAAAGEDRFKSCKACHSVIAPDGTEFQRGGRTGPNLHGIIGKPVGSVAGFKYGEVLPSLGAAGLVWDEANLAAFIVDPIGWVREKTGDASAKSRMSFRLAEGSEDIAAYLASLH